MFRLPRMGPRGRLAQWESASLTRKRSEVQILQRPLGGHPNGAIGAAVSVIRPCCGRQTRVTHYGSSLCSGVRAVRPGEGGGATRARAAATFFSDAMVF